MSRYISVVWVTQFLVLVVLALALLVRPQIVPELLDGCTPGKSQDGNEHLFALSEGGAGQQKCEPKRPIQAREDHPAWEEVRFVQSSSRLLAPFVILLALFTLHAFMREDLRVRRRLARIFAATGCVLFYFLVLPLHEELHSAPFVLLFLLYELMREETSKLRQLLRISLVTGCFLAYSLVSSLYEGAGSSNGDAFISLSRCANSCLLGHTPSAQDACLRPCISKSLDLLKAQSEGSDALLKSLGADNPRRKELLGCIVLLALFVVSNLVFALWPLPPAVRRLSGSADTLPPQLWILWLVQGLFFFLTAILFMLFNEAGWVLADPPYLKPLAKEWLHYPGVLRNFQQLNLPLFFFAGMLSFAGMKSSREWGWRAYSRLFGLFYGTWFLTFLFVWDTSFNPLLVFYLGCMFVLFVGNSRFWSKSDSWFTEEVGEGPDGWILADLLVGPLLLLRTILTRRRAIYPRGVAARGSFQASRETHAYPWGQQLAHDFFTPDARFKAQVRFSTEGSDEAALAMRGAALRLQSVDEEDFELMLGTGAHCPAENIVEFAQMCLVRTVGGLVERWFWRSHPRMREGLAATLRRAPRSYVQMQYHSQTVRFWIARSGLRYLVRYRLVPDEPDFLESGLPGSERDLGLTLERRRQSGESRPTDYLRQELKRRLEGRRTCTLQLEAQFHSPRLSDNTYWFNPSVDWNSDEHPWLKLGQLTLEEIIPDEQAELLRFNPANVPPSLGTPASAGPLDYRSIADSEKRVHQRIQRTRQWMARAWGVPSLEPVPPEST